MRQTNTAKAKGKFIYSWCETMWHDKCSVAAEIECQKLFATSNESTGHALSQPIEEYIEILFHET